ncbi:TetR/AcrR family transcriptional regulator [Pontiella agarivorans]|uniref:TetR/AcrR family transcriptional regulator n=1 Tax=Pontiella agarivorans TaxID=3038953 RepID=A0ABU5MXH3_9BACT|nr:TetR/AcrR family transcriptional regulator [Pontiella agarivorans]MDZ8118895.1 TetR/AcrR family transcriptional regulator [Pontiella agarivorans]
MNGKPTRERILEAAEALMLEHSFHAVGLKQLLDAVKVPKGSFYHYFESKEQFGIEMMKHYMAEASAHKRSFMLNRAKEPDALKRLFQYLEGSIAFMDKHPGRFPCLAVKLGNEVSEISEGMREELMKGFNDWISIYQEVLDDAVAAGQLPKDFDTAAEASLIQDHWAGAAQRAVIFQTSEPVRLTVEHIKHRLEELRT